MSGREISADREDAIGSADKLTQFWKEQAEGYKEMMERKEIAATDKINKLTGDLGKLQGRIGAVAELHLVHGSGNAEGHIDALRRGFQVDVQDRIDFRAR